MKALFTKYPVAGFIGLTFLISLGMGFPLKLFVLNPVFFGSEIGINYISKILVVFGPAIAAVTVTAITGGGEGVLALLKKLKPDTEHIIWWVGLPFACMGITITAFVIGGFTLEQLVVAMTDVSPLLLMAHIFASMLMIGLGEEIGWRGWLLPKLSHGRPIGLATLMVFTTWALWHFPIFFSGYRTAIPFIVMVSALSVLFTWLWYRTDGNLFVMVIAHASVDFPYAFFDERVGKKHLPEVLNAWIALAIIYLVIAAAIYYATKEWWATDITAKPEAPADPLEDMDKSNSFM
ncbi:CPBP family intramembrane glutamic endopeptidase [Mucilaginibacter pedocola]|uniref:CAAX prenyl protease 2/Lysostaphin resistance protein A-like domain-containing protein n=1 Tax=Mucilaginibacter pedocola TaxID=1792845 RepID=A0A1S9P8G7_9SPHI|nr:type II CAAX endopeptidase family protein [Mucilaginibacter pedocola]OOQ57234.1 hypothetical protein BC343_14040 [Mucilaginibacter pedocola]